MIEIWKPIKHYESFYEISNFGRIKSVSRYVKNSENTYRLIKERILINKQKDNGYLYVCLTKNNNKKYYHVHRLVADAYLENNLNKEQVNHKNGIKTDNNFYNLEWVTCSENHLHASKILHRNYVSGSLNKFGKDNKKSLKINQLTLNNKFIRTWDCIHDVERELNIDNGAISACCRKKYGYKSAGGFKWEYYN